MKKEELSALGLTEEQVNKVIDGFGLMIPKARLDEKIDQVKALTAQVTDYDAQLEELKKVDAAGLQAKILELQDANTSAQTEFAKQLLDTQIDNGLALELTGKVHDVGVALGLINREALTLTDGKITGGLEDQVKTLRESKSFLFVPETSATPVPPRITGASPHKTDNVSGNEPLSTGAQFAKTANTSTSPAAKDPWGL